MAGLVGGLLQVGAVPGPSKLNLSTLVAAVLRINRSQR